MRVAILLTLALLAVPAAHAAVATFATPSQWSGQAKGSGTQWAVLILSPDEPINGTFRIPGETLATTYQAVKPRITASPVLHAADAYDLPPSSERVTQPIDASVTMVSDSWKSVFIRAGAITASATGAGEVAMLPAGDPVDRLLPTRDFPSYTLHPGYHTVAANEVAFSSTPTYTPATRFAIQVSGLQELEFLNATLECRTNGCPQQTPSGPVVGTGVVQADVLRYLNLESSNGSAEFSGTAWGMAFGGASLDVELGGDARLVGLDLARTCGATSCIQSSGQTLRATGNLTFGNLHATGLDGNLAGDLTVQSGSTRLDESPFDSGLLGGLGTTAAVAAVGAGVLVLAAKLLAPLFTRIAQPEALQNERRRRLHQIISAQPGISYNRLIEAAGMSRGAARHHLHVLENIGLIQTESLGLTRRHFPRGLDHAARQGLAILQDPLCRRIAEALGQGGRSQGQLVQAFAAEAPRSTIQFKLGQLARANIVRSSRVGRQVVYWRVPANGLSELPGAAAVA